MRQATVLFYRMWCNIFLYVVHGRSRRHRWGLIHWSSKALHTCSVDADGQQLEALQWCRMNTTGTQLRPYDLVWMGSRDHCWSVLGRKMTEIFCLAVVTSDAQQHMVMISAVQRYVTLLGS